jgi:hypothetical protein
MIGSKTMKRAAPKRLQTDSENQVRCWTGDQGCRWIHYYDQLPPAVRRRLRQSPFNLCPACLVCTFLPEVRTPRLTREKALLAGIEIMESAVRGASFKNTK